jgi:glycine cleavage system H lipoate-binding protein
MEGFTYVDIFATKGIEYLLVIGFLLVLVPFWRFLRVPARAGMEVVRRAMASVAQWFSVPEGLYYHQGHSWVMPQGAELVKVGVDDFAQRLVGSTNKINLPKVGSRIEQGDVGWKLGIDAKTIDMLSPVTGDVVAVNKDIVKNPTLINQDPYGKGWLMMVKPANQRATVKNLLTGKLATAWMEKTADALRERIGGDELGVVYQDGGLPVSGIAKALSPDAWDKMAGEFFLTQE